MSAATTSRKVTYPSEVTEYLRTLRSGVARGGVSSPVLRYARQYAAFKFMGADRPTPPKYEARQDVSTVEQILDSIAAGIYGYAGR